MFVFRCRESGKKCVAMARKNLDGGPRPRRRPPATPRLSPTLQGHYAGCKWTEPPLPSALPPPPQHWMQAPHAVLPFRQPPPPEQHIENQLKVLLKVQA